LTDVVDTEIRSRTAGDRTRTTIAVVDAGPWLMAGAGTTEPGTTLPIEDARACQGDARSRWSAKSITAEAGAALPVRCAGGIQDLTGASHMADAVTAKAGAALPVQCAVSIDHSTGASRPTDAVTAEARAALPVRCAGGVEDLTGASRAADGVSTEPGAAVRIRAAAVEIVGTGDLRACSVLTHPGAALEATAVGAGARASGRLTGAFLDLLALAVRKGVESALTALLAAEFLGLLAALSFRGTLLARGDASLGMNRLVATLASGPLSGGAMPMAFGQDAVAQPNGRQHRGAKRPSHHRAPRERTGETTN